jgi:adenylosuccinate lyase
MEKIWSDEFKFETWLKVELAVCEAWAKLGKIPKKDLLTIQKKAQFNLDRIYVLESKLNHDLIAFLTCVAEFIGPSSRYVHLGLTSTDVVDTAQALQIKASVKLIEEQLIRLLKILKLLAKKHKNDVMIGRTHGVHAEPITFGLKMAVWHEEIKRHIKRLKIAEEEMNVGKISGAVGTYANITPQIEIMACKKLGLKPAPIATQTLQRDRHAFFLSVLAGIGNSLEKFSTEIRNLQRTEVLEVEEFFQAGQKGSSAMPHKKNPLTCERIVGLSRVLRGYALAAQENVALWHERDITHSSAERVIFPDSTSCVHYMLVKFVNVIQNLNIYSKKMLKNIYLTHGLIFSQRVLLSLVDKGLTREKAYLLVQRNALKAWESEVEFKTLLLEDEEIKKILSVDEINEIFDLNYHLKHVDYILKRLQII